jgi:1-acyl-sn-glycerol-3-phosphate acyltransferase
MEVDVDYRYLTGMLSGWGGLVSFFRSVGRSVHLVGIFVVAGTELLVKRPASRQARADWLHRFCARAMRGLDIKITVIGSFPARGAVISNHLSYLDIVMFASLHPCVFVSKAEIAGWPVIGWMTTMAGTVYVERGRGGSAIKASGGMLAAEEAGLPVVFFPEGTTTNGGAMLNFHSGLLGQALAARQKVSAAYIYYEIGTDNGADVTVADDVAYWGDRSMWPHVFKFLGLRNVRAVVRFADGPIAFSSDILHRKLAAVEGYSAVFALERMARQKETTESVLG